MAIRKQEWWGAERYPNEELGVRLREITDGCLSRTSLENTLQECRTMAKVVKAQKNG